MHKVTVAKEVIRLLGEVRADAAYDHLLWLDGTPLHRDVRIALLRSHWDHLDREPTWAVFARAVEAPDWVMASRIGDIPADRLSRASDRRLSALLGRVLDRPEPEARIDLLRRAALLAVSDPDRTFLAAAASRLVSVYDDEVEAAVQAMLHRSTEDDLARLPALLAVATNDPRCLHVAVAALTAFPVKSRASWVGAFRAARPCSRTTRAGSRLSAPELAACLAALGEAGALTGDALDASRTALDALPVGALTGASRSARSRATRGRAAGGRRSGSRCSSHCKRTRSPVVAGAAHVLRPVLHAAAPYVRPPDGLRIRMASINRARRHRLGANVSWLPRAPGVRAYHVLTTWVSVAVHFRR